MKVDPVSLPLNENQLSEMTNLALAEKIREILVAHAHRVDTEQHNRRVIHRVTIGKQVFVVTCEESVPDKSEPAV